MTANNALPFAGEICMSFFLGNWRQLEIEATFVPNGQHSLTSVERPSYPRSDFVNV